MCCSSKDTFIKFWDLDTQHCFKTVLGHRTEVWDFVIVNNDTRLITGSGDNELRIWRIDHLPEVQKRLYRNKQFVQHLLNFKILVFFFFVLFCFVF